MQLKWALAAVAMTILPLHRHSSAGAQVLIGSPEDDRRRIAQILGTRSAAGEMIRSPSSTIEADSLSRLPVVGLVRPVIDGTYNAQLPFSIDDGALWAGRGASTRLTVGIDGRVGPVRYLAAPELMHSANLAFSDLPSNIPGRSSFASPFYAGPRSIDLPERFGREPFSTITPGQSAVWVSARGADIGASTENQWWGPAIQNALVMSNNAAGIPSVFVRTNRPWQTRIGSFEAKAVAGGLTESRYFDTVSTNDVRALSGVVATYSPSVEPNVTVGVSRVVYANAPRASNIAGNALGALTRWSTTRVDSTATGSDAFDDMMSFFGRWIFPASGLEVYAEWARMLPPVSLRDWLIAPQYTQGFTIGMQVARPIRAGAVLRFQAEFTDLEQTPPSRAGDTLTYYTSRAVAQGYTQRGQAIGAAIGPGGSSQLVAVDYMPARWDVGLFAERIRWNNDVYYLQPSGFSFFAQDVSVMGGLRGTFRWRRSEVHAEFSLSQRLNFLFQALRGGFGPERSNDAQDHSLRFWIVP
ncbi:MAG TPA: capsule assembly Wzi family protein [Gemmatimonadaceae bacterium]|nr:capsule assembly Wzi family protein [Gemmatimonadaceae bacterium]